MKYLSVKAIQTKKICPRNRTSTSLDISGLKYRSTRKPINQASAKPTAIIPRKIENKNEFLDNLRMRPGLTCSYGRLVRKTLVKPVSAVEATITP